MRLLIGGMVNVGQSDLYDEDRAMALNRLLEDTIDALLEDPRFGFGPSVDSVLESGDDVIDMDRGFGVFALQMHVTYHFTRGTL
jgi:hypothetical protein